MKVFIYERVSSEEQAKHGYSLDAQHEALTEFCKKHNHVILGEYRDEGISARKPYTKRPAMLQLLRDVEIIKPDMILFTKLDRWFRNIKEYYKVQDILDRYKVDWKAINEEYDTSTASGRLYVNIKLSIAQDEADRTSERIKDIQDQLVAQGKVLGGKVPHGYRIENKHIVFADNINETKDAVDYYMTHHSLYGTVRHINETYGTHFTQQHMKTLLQNPLLKGEYRNNPNFCAPLITANRWSALQDLLARRNVKRASHRVFLFSGMIRCPVCGRRLGGCHSTAQYYRCLQHVQGTCSFSRWINESKVEKWLLENVEEDFKVQVTMKPKEKREDPKKYKDRLARLNDMYLLGTITQEEYKQKSAVLLKQIAELSKKPSLKTQNFASDWKDIYYRLDAEHRRSFWQNLIQQIVVSEQAQVVGVLY